MKRALCFLLCFALLTSCFILSVSASALHPFSDVEVGSWYESGIMYAYEKGLMVGTSKTEFSPNENMTRAMIVTVLYRMEGAPSVEGADFFSDVPENEWYTDAVIWAAKENIVGGYGNGKFCPQDCITRQQLAAILFRYDTYKGVSAPVNGWVSNYPDTNQVSAWALTAMQWATREGYISGINANGRAYLQPESSASRAQIATILMRYLCKDIDGTIDISALEESGREYAASLGFKIDTTMTPDNSSHYPGDRVTILSMEEGIRLVKENIRATADELIACGDEIDGYRCNVFVQEDGEGGYIIWVMYG